MIKLFASCFLFYFFLCHLNAEDAIPENFACEVRYHFLGFHSNDERPSYRDCDIESLPPSFITKLHNDFYARVVKGSVKNLPYSFTIKMTKKNNSDPGIIEVNVIDASTKKSINGFPRQIASPLKQNLEDERTDFDIKVPEALENKIIEFYMTPRGYPPPDGQLTYINLIIGIDQPFFEEVNYFRNYNPFSSKTDRILFKPPQR